MAQQSIALPAAWFTTTGSIRGWTAPDNSRPAIDAGLTPGVARNLEAVQVQGAVSSGRIILRLSGGQTGVASNEDLSSDFETSGQVRLTSGTESLTISTSGADTAEPYVFPYTAAGLTFFNALTGAAGSRGGTLILADTTIVDDVTVVLPVIAEQTGTVGAALNIVLPEATQGNVPITYTLTGLPDGATFTAGTRTIGGTPTEAGTFELTYRATDNDNDFATRTFNLVVATSGGIYLGGEVYRKIYVAGQELTKGFLGGVAVFGGGAPVPPSPPAPTHTFTMGVGNGGYNAPLSRGSIQAGSTATYDTPGGKTVTVIHCRAVGSELNFALADAANDAADFPARIVATKLTGGEVERTFTPQEGSTARRTIRGGVRQDYDPTSGSVNDVFVRNQTVRVQLFY